MVIYSNRRLSYDTTEHNVKDTYFNKNKNAHLQFHYGRIINVCTTVLNI